MRRKGRLSSSWLQDHTGCLERGAASFPVGTEKNGKGGAHRVLQVRLAIINFESGRYLGELLESVELALASARKHIDVEIAVVVMDNASRDQSAEACSRSSASVSLRRLPENVGFGAAANMALAGAREAWLLVLNADLLLPADFFLRLAEATDCIDERVALMGPAMIDEDSSAQPSVGRFPNLLSSVLGMLRPRRLRKYEKLATHLPGPVDWVTGACLIVSNAAWQQLEGFNSRFFLYYEDVDLARRARAADYTTCFVPALTVIHRAPLAQRDVSPALIPIIRYSQLLYFRLHRPAIEFFALSLATLLFSFAAQLRGNRRSWREVRRLPLRVLREQPGPLPSSSRGPQISAAAASPKV